MKLLMPKPFKENKITIYKNFTLIDFFVFLALILIAVLIVIFIPFSPILKVIVGIPLSIPAFIMILKNNKNNCRNYELIIRWFKFKSYIKDFRKKTLIEAGSNEESYSSFDSGIVISDTRVLINPNDDINWLHAKYIDINFLKVIDAMYSQDQVFVTNLFDDLDDPENIIEVSNDETDENFETEENIFGLENIDAELFGGDNNEFSQ